jgi:holliday junction DNA helicase RuvA
MIEYIKGEVVELTPTYAVIDCHGIGYNLNISLNTYTAVQGNKTVQLYVYESIREDSYTLFGFASRDERTIFLLLIGVSGIGGQSARMVLSAFTPQEFCNVVSAGDERQLRSVKGIGPKAAQRIIVDLKDALAKLVMSGDNTSSNASFSVPVTNAKNVEEASSALVMLGFSPAPVRKTVLSIVKQEPEATVEQIIKQALKML